MKLERALVVLIACEFVLGILGVIFEYAAEPSVTSSLRAHLADAGFRTSRGHATLATVWWAAVVAATIVAWLGLLNQVRGARPLYLVTWAGYLLLILLQGPAVGTATGYLIQMLMALVGGSIIGLVYFSELRTKFRGLSEIFGQAAAKAA